MKARYIKPECQNEHPMHANYPASRWLSVVKTNDLDFPEAEYFCTCCQLPVPDNATSTSWGQLHHLAQREATE